MKPSAYDRSPLITVPACGPDDCIAGWPAICGRLRRELNAVAGRRILTVETYPGTRLDVLQAALQRGLDPVRILCVEDALLPPADIDRLIAPFLGDGDPVFGRLAELNLTQFYDPDALSALRAKAVAPSSGIIVVMGCGAGLVAEPDVFVYADLSRWEAQLRFRRGESTNFGSHDTGTSAGQRYKRAFFVDWRVADRWKQPFIRQAGHWLDLHDPEQPKLAAGDAVRRGLAHAVTRPFRVVPFFDPAPWGGQWMKRVCGLDSSAANYGWCFDGVPEENSLVLAICDHAIEIPALDLVLDQPVGLLGADVFASFGAEFPIRFDLLDTMGGGNLSLQVHPQVEYIRRHFGMPYTQDESYYILDAEPDSGVFLGFREDIDAAKFARALKSAQAGGPPVVAETFVNQWPAQPHDHFLIPAGTIHCSGRGTMVLEISATPYIFTFKLWDWGRLGLDGHPRPIHLEHGLANLDWDRRTEWVRQNLINRINPLAEGPGWRSETTGLHPLQFIETTRHWFTDTTPHDTAGNLNVLNLVSGEAAVVESPDHAFTPFTVHYVETFIVPAAVGPYTVRPLHPGDEKHATVKAHVNPARRLSR